MNDRDAQAGPRIRRGPYVTEHITGLDDHLDWMRRCGLAESTMTQRAVVLTYVAEFLGADPADATHDDLDRWQSSLDTLPKIRWQTSMITPYYRWLQARGHRQDNPAALLPRPARHRRVRRAMPDDDLLAAVVAAPPMPQRVALLLAGWSGMRCTELANLDREHLRPGEHGHWIAVLHGKGGHQREVPIVDWVYAEIEPHLPEAGPIFTRRYGDRTARATRKQISQNLSYYLRKRGCTDTLHALRRRVATGLMHQTRDVRLVQELLGHANLSALHFYLTTSIGAMTDAVALLPRPRPIQGPLHGPTDEAMPA